MARRSSVLKIAARCLLLAAALCLCACRTDAQETLLTLRTLRDNGGLTRGLNARLTTALLRFLSDHGDNVFQAIVAPAPAPLNPAIRYTLEGELSCANGRGEDNARFLLVTRLYREGERRVLVGQWAGTSTSLRALTVNLRRDPRFHTLGLVGEIGSRIVSALTADQSGAGGRWRRLLPRLAGRNFPAEVGLVDGANHVLRQVPPSAPFRLRAAGASVQRMYLLAVLSDGELRVLPLSETREELQNPDGKIALSQAIMLPEDAAEVWIVCRMSAANTKSAGFRRGAGRRWCARNEDDAPVHILDGVGNEVPAPDANAFLTHLLAAIAREPTLWRVARFRVAPSPSHEHAGA